MSQKEFDLLEKHIKAGSKGDKTLLVGIGDDAAVVAGNSSLKYSYTTDATIEEVHFSRRYFSIADIARKVVAVNFSDLAAMGSTPKYLLSSIIAPHRFEVGELIDAIANEVKKYGAELIGGNLSQGHTLAITATAIGTSPSQSHLLLRSGAKVGDLLYATGPLGASSAGLRSFNARSSIDPPSRYGNDGHEVIDEYSLVPPSIRGYRMYAGGALGLRSRFFEKGDYLKISSIDKVATKVGRSGELTFIDIVHEVTSAATGVQTFRDTQNLVYLSDRPYPRHIVVSEANQRGLYAVSTTETGVRANFAANSSILFRYSALTYNGHKIHLDRDYCHDVESLPGLVVHGPLLATLGATLAKRLCRGDEEIVELKFRLHSTLFEDELASFLLKRDGDRFAGSALRDGEVVITFEGSFGTI